MWFTLGKLALKTGAEIYKNKKRAKLLESEAEVKHLARAVAGEVQLQKIVHKRQESDLTDRRRWETTTHRQRQGAHNQPVYSKEFQTLRDTFYKRVFRGEGATANFRVLLY